MQADQLESELENLLNINEMYQDTIKDMEQIIEKKDQVIIENLKIIAKLTEGSAQELKDIQLAFFS